MCSVSTVRHVSWGRRASRWPGQALAPGPSSRPQQLPGDPDFQVRVFERTYHDVSTFQG